MIKTLDDSNNAYEFQGVPETTRVIGTSGTIGGGTLRLQYRVEESDDWVDNPNYDSAADLHIAGVLVLPSQYNRVFLDGSSGASVNVSIQ